MMSTEGIEEADEFEIQGSGLEGAFAGLQVEENQPSWTQAVIGQWAPYQFSEGGVSLPCVSTSLGIKEFITLVTAAESVPPEISRTWIISELFQRDIDMDRVRNEIVDGYLRSEGHTTYLPSVTVVLHAQEPGETRTIIDTWSDVVEGEHSPGPIDDQFREILFTEGENRFLQEHKSVKGVDLLRSRLENLALLRWDQKRACAIAIDGQHRLKAIEYLIQVTYGGVPSTNILNTRIPVQFLLPIPQFGYNGNLSSREVSREVFTDVNKTPQQPTQARLILLKDQDIVSLCTRKIVTDSVPGDDENRVPLCMIRWKKDEVPFNGDWYFNSITNIRQIVSDILDLKPITKPLDYQNVTNFISSLESAIGDVIADGKTLQEYFEDNYVSEDEREAGEGYSSLKKPFTENQIPKKYLTIIENAFIEKHRGYLIKMFREITPYSAYLSYCNDQNLISGNFGGYMSQPNSHRTRLENEGGDDWLRTEITNKKTALTDIKKESDESLGLAWYAVFQRSLIKNCNYIEIVQGGTAANLGNSDDYLKNMNELSNLFYTNRPLPGKDKFVWSIIATRWSNNKPTMSGANQRRIEALLLIWHMACQIDRNDKASGGELRPIDDVYTLLTNDQLSGQYPKAIECIKTLNEGFTSSELFKGEDNEETTTLKANHRVKELIQLARDTITHEEE